MMSQTLTDDELRPLQELRSSMATLNTSLHALLSLFFAEDSTVECTTPGDERFEKMVRLVVSSGKRSGQRVALNSILLSDHRSDLLRVCLLIHPLGRHSSPQCLVVALGTRGTGSERCATLGGGIGGGWSEGRQHSGSGLGLLERCKTSVIT